MYWTLELASYLEDAPWPATKDELIEFSIRTGGEQRISNFMLLQLSYSELYFSDLSWPEFDSFEYEKSLKSFSNRERRFGSNVNQQRKLNNYFSTK